MYVQAFGIDNCNQWFSNYYSASSLITTFFNFLKLLNIFPRKSVVLLAISMSFGIEVDASYLYLNLNSGGHRMNHHVCTTSNVTGTGASVAAASF